MKANVFEYKHYRDYLKVRLSTSGASRGLRARLAEKTGTVPSFISRVLNGDMDLSPEHIPPVNQLLEHTQEESHFFTLLVLDARAGTKDLERYYREQIKEVLEKRSNLAERIKASETVNNTDQAKYYSQWYYSVLHLMAALPQFSTREAMASRLHLPLSVISKALDELQRMGVIQSKGSRYTIGKKRIHLAKDSPWISQLHTHSRNRAIYRLAAPEPNDLHLSQTMGVSHEFIEEYRKRILDLLAEFEGKMLDAKEEELFVLNIDLFKL